MKEALATLLQRPQPILALAPMQDITDLPFWKLIHKRGAPDVFYTEYFRVFPGSHLSRRILSSITENPTGRPVIAQLIGNDVPSLLRAARELERYPVAGIDLNLGCPAPIVYRKCAGGGLLRDPGRIDEILAALRQTVTTHFTVKTRVGFDSPAVFEQLLGIFSKHSLDLLTVHGRTVSDMYRAPVRYDLIAQAAAALPCPVLANGNIQTAPQALDVLHQTGARGLMVGRGAVRNPWIFSQIRAQAAGQIPHQPTGHALLEYIHELHTVETCPNSRDAAQVQRLKKFMNFLAPGIGPQNQFLFQIQRVRTLAEFFTTCAQFLAHDGPAFTIPAPGSPERTPAPATITC